MAKNFTVYSSSAGSGKTHTLVREYIRIALSEPNNPKRFAGILAITFTNKAAEEMKERVVTNLFKLQVPSSHPLYSQKYLDEISEVTQLSSTEVQIRAKKAFETLLHNYHLLKITTIDKFTVSLVYAFARDLGLEAEYEIVLDQNEVIDAGIKILLERSGKDKELTQMILSFLQSELDEGNKFNVTKELKGFCDKIFNEKGYRALKTAENFTEEDFFEAGRTAAIKSKLLQDEYKAIAKKGLDLLNANGIEPSHLHQGTKSVYSVFEKVVKKDFTADFKDTYTLQFIEGSHLNKKVKPEIAQRFALIADEVVAQAKKMLEFRDQKYQEYFIHQAVRKNAFAMTLFRKVNDAVMQYKDTNSIILLSEFTKLVSDTVIHEPAPFIYERLGERVKNIFVDEFQDTSSLQFSNLVPLIDNSLSSGQFVMLVGDAKQSIYRWRNGNVEQFVDLPNLPPETIEIEKYRQTRFTQEHFPKNLPDNYRSLRNIVEFNNSLFEQILKDPLIVGEKLHKAYADVKQNYLPEKEGGYVHFEVLNKSDVDEEVDSTLVDEELELNEAPAVDFALRAIQNCVERNYSYSDIAILVRTNREGEMIFKGLSEKGIPVVSNQALTVNVSPDVKALMLCFSCMHHNVSRTQLKQLGLELSTVFNRSDFFELNMAMFNADHLEMVFKSVLLWFGIELDRSKFLGLNLFEQFMYLQHCFKTDSNNVFIATLNGIVFDYFKRHGSNPIGFIQYWKNTAQTTKVQTGDGGNKVKVYTIHKSKGLQFPVVILPFANQEFKRNEKFFWLYNVPGYKIEPIPVTLSEKLVTTEWYTESEIEKERTIFDVLNLLYVAVTRAEEELYCLVDCSVSVKKTLGVCIQNALKIIVEKQQSDTYTLGAQLIKNKKQEIKSEGNQMDVSANDFTPWFKKLCVSTREVEKQLEYNELKEEGILMHEIFARLNKAEDIEPVLTSFLLLRKISEQQFTAFISIFNDMYKSEVLNLISANLHSQVSEIGLMDLAGNKYRADKLIFKTDGKAVLIDLKTGEEEEDHYEQIKKYCSIIEQSGIAVDSSWLYYVKTSSWIKVNG